MQGLVLTEPINLKVHQNDAHGLDNLKKNVKMIVRIGVIMSAILAMSMAHYGMMRNNALNNMFMANNARMGLMSYPMQNINFCGIDRLAFMDNQMELNAINYSIQYQMAKAMLEKLKILQKEETKHLNTFA